MQAKRYIEAWMVHSCKNLRLSIFGCTCLVTSTMFGTSLGMSWKSNMLFISKQKHSFSQMLFSSSTKLLSETQFFLSNFMRRKICTGKNRLGHIFYLKYVSRLISYCYISGNLEHIYPKKQQDNSEKGSGTKHMEWGRCVCVCGEGVMQGERLLNRIGMAYWLSLPNHPSFWTISATHCTILLQEIYFGPSQYYKCSSSVSGWGHNLSLTWQMDFARLFETLLSPWGNADSWPSLTNEAGPHISI